MQQLDEVINTEKLMRGYFSKARIEEHIKHINALNNDLKAGSIIYEGIYPLRSFSVYNLI